MRKLQRVGPTEWRFQWDRAFWDESERIDEAIDQATRGHLVAAARHLEAVLRRCPEHLDAMFHLALVRRDQGGPEEAERIFRDAVALGRTAFPPRAFKVGRDLLDWGWLENRPFLRCLDGLMAAHWRARRNEEALPLARELLAMNPNDNQGARTIMMAMLLERGGNEEAALLAERYPEDMLAEIAYGRALALFRLQRPYAAAEALTEAIEDLPKVADELLREGHDAPPDLQPERVTMGGPDQAYLYWLDHGHLWERTPGAMEWLRHVRAESTNR